MPGSWEVAYRPYVLTAVLHTETTSIAWAFGLRSLQLPGPVIGIAGMPFDHARNTACMRALEGGFTHLFFLDSDVIPPPDTVPRLLAHRQQFISGVYHRRSPPHGIPVMLRKGQWIVKYPPNRVIEVDLVGAGCLLIAREVLEKLPPSRPEAGKHWFDWRVDMGSMLPPGEATSEDFTTCLNVKRQLGVPVLVDTSIICRHVGLAQAGLHSMVPCEAGHVA